MQVVLENCDFLKLIMQLFCARQHICYCAHMLSQFRLSVRPSVRLTHGWFMQKRLKLGSCSFHHTVAPSLWFLCG